MNIDDFLKERSEAGQEVVVTEIGLSPPRRYEVWGETVLVKPVAHAVSFIDEQGRAVTALIVGDQGRSRDHGGEEPLPGVDRARRERPGRDVTLRPAARAAGEVKADRLARSRSERGRVSYGSSRSHGQSFPAGATAAGSRNVRRRAKMHEHDRGQSTRKAYWVNTFRSVRDPHKLAAYIELAGPVMREFAGRFLARVQPTRVYESGIMARTVVIESTASSGRWPPTADCDGERASCDARSALLPRHQRRPGTPDKDA